MSRKVLTQLIRNEEDRRLVRYAVLFGLGIKWTLFDGVWNAYVNKDYRIWAVRKGLCADKEERRL